MHVRDLALQEASSDREVLPDVPDLEARSLARVLDVLEDGHAASTEPPEMVSSRWSRLYSTSSQQRSRWPALPTLFSSSGSSMHLSNACGQRGRNLQPSGRLISDGGEPSIVCRRSGREIGRAHV